MFIKSLSLLPCQHVFERFFNKFVIPSKIIGTLIDPIQYYMYRVDTEQEEKLRKFYLKN